MKNTSVMKRLTAMLLSGCMLAAQTAAIPTYAAETDMPDFSGLGAIGTLTAAQTQAVAESIYTAVKNHQSVAALSTKSGEFIPAKSENMDSIMSVFATVIGGYDVGILTIKNQISTRMSRSSKIGNYISGVNIFYLVSDTSYSATYKAMLGKLDAISAQVQDDWSPVEKALFLHDYIAVHYNYDYTESPDANEEYYRHTAYNMLATGKGVCEAYAWLYNILLEREGIESFMMTSDSMLHAWNVVHLDGGWAHVDITWDDYYQEHAGLVRHDGFLKGHDAFLKARHTGDDWKLASGLPESEMQITDRYNGGFWTDSIAAIQYYDGGWLAIIPDEVKPNVGWFNLYQYNAKANTASCTSLLSLCEYWTVPGKMLCYPASFIVPAVYDGVLYYSDKGRPQGTRVNDQERVSFGIQPHERPKVRERHR
ncbi:MAG: hypothetical protein IJ906_15800 [Oscillospiraceae bacterium]|nr:hypothetical protein [Oscillospiraceae bacterium]